MRLIPSLLSPLLSLLLLATSALSSSLTITIPPSALLPNPNVLPAGTHATLTTLSNPNPEPLSAPLSRSATFSFRDIPSTTTGGSYLLDIRSAEYVFAPYRVDVAPDGKVLGVWETFRGNPWENRGAEKFNVVVDVDASAGGGGRDVRVEAGVLARRGFFEQRAVFSPISLFKNPMIFLAVVALGFTFGMPKLMENMDPEMRAEFEKQSRSSPISGSARNAINGGGGPGNFDLAGWMAGTAPGPIGGAEPAEKAPVTTGREGGGATRRRG